MLAVCRSGIHAGGGVRLFGARNFSDSFCLERYIMDLTTLHEKMDIVLEKVADLDKKLTVHIATEEQDRAENKRNLADINARLEAHLREHKDAYSTWRKGAIGAIFMVLGSFVVWLGSFLWSHKG